MEGLTVTGAFAVRSTSLPRVNESTSVAANIPSSTPGIATQPRHLHGSIRAQTVFTQTLGGTFRDLPSQDDPHFQPRLLLTFANNVSNHWADRGRRPAIRLSPVCL